MKIAYLIKKKQLYSDSAVTGLLEKLSESGMQVYDILQGLAPDTDMLLSFGGDGTFLSAANLVCRDGIPILGVNLGRLGFLSEYDVTQVYEALSEGKYGIVERSLLEARIDGEMPSGFSPYALNEVVVRRQGTGTLGIEASIDSEPLPTYWADGMLVSTSSGSTAYSLSVGGPICSPELDAFILAPIAPHNLNLRPLLLSKGARINICARDRKGTGLALSLDNRDYLIPSGTSVSVSSAPFKLRKVVLGKSNFIKALRAKLLWGEDVRNNT